MAGGVRVVNPFDVAHAQHSEQPVVLFVVKWEVWPYHNQN